MLIFVAIVVIVVIVVIFYLPFFIGCIQVAGEGTSPFCHSCIPLKNYMNDFIMNYTCSSLCYLFL